ncbi:acetyl-CoA carboxylase [Histoplasma ohiense]|nr:acetyl-CoA carboxylase [Histoplasma ohiense (nom. inval.)]
MALILIPAPRLISISPMKKARKPNADQSPRVTPLLVVSRPRTPVKVSSPPAEQCTSSTSGVAQMFGVISLLVPLVGSIVSLILNSAISLPTAKIVPRHASTWSSH